MPIEHEGKMYYSEEERSEYTKIEVDKQITGLKSNNSELKADLDKAKSALKPFQSLGDLKEIQDTLDLVKNNPDIKTIRESGVDTLVAKRTERQQAEWQEKLTAATAERDSYKNTLSELKSKNDRAVISDAVRKAAVEAKVRPEALDDVISRALSVFSIGEDGKPEARDAQGHLVKLEGDKLVTPSNFVESLKKAAPHYWPSSTGSGSDGSGDGGGASGDDLEIQIKAALAANNQELFRKLRRKQLDSRK